VDEVDSEFCSDCRNCCRTSAGELAFDELLVLLLDDELEDDALAGDALADDAPP
jgi:hypothetical protein